ncbi:hypothetical protein [Sphingobacterium kyonggiense]
MISVEQLTQRNKFNGITYIIRIDSFLSVYILETNTNSFLIEIKEEKIFSTKTHLSRISNNSLKNTIIMAFDYLMEVIVSHKNYNWSNNHKEIRLNETLNDPMFYKLI